MEFTDREILFQKQPATTGNPNQIANIANVLHVKTNTKSFVQNLHLRFFLEIFRCKPD